MDSSFVTGNLALKCLIYRAVNAVVYPDVYIFRNVNKGSLMFENPTARATENPRLDVWMFPCCTVPTSGFHDNGGIALVSLIREETPSIEENHALFTGSNK